MLASLLFWTSFTCRSLVRLWLISKMHRRLFGQVLRALSERTRMIFKLASCRGLASDPPEIVSCRRDHSCIWSRNRTIFVGHLLRSVSVRERPSLQFTASSALLFHLVLLLRHPESCFISTYERKRIQEVLVFYETSFSRTV